MFCITHCCQLCVDTDLAEFHGCPGQRRLLDAEQVFNKYQAVDLLFVFEQFIRAERPGLF